MHSHVLLVGDGADLLEPLRQALGAGWEVQHHPTAGASLAAIEEHRPRVVLTEACLDRGSEGITLCQEIVTRWPQLPVIVLTSDGSLELAVASMRAGAFDFLTRPIDPELLRLALERAMAHHQLKDEVRQLRRRVRLARGLGALVGESPAMQRVYDIIERVAGVSSSVLLTGESGTGKELVARALHAQSSRASAPFVAINCGAIPEHLLESELFGHVRGAFTDARSDRTGLFVRAHRGTLFLDEIGDMPLPLQTKLLRVLEQRSVRPVGGERELPIDVRLIAATHQDLDAAAIAGRFRDDLLFRIDVIRIDLPPLRARDGDVLLLAQRFLQDLATSFDKPIEGFSPEAGRRLVAYRWPGNVRELRNCVEHAVVLASGAQIQVDELPPKVRRAQAPPTHRAPPPPLRTLAEVEREHILRVLAACGGRRTEAASVLGLDRKTLYRKLERYRRLEET